MTHEDKPLGLHVAEYQPPPYPSPVFIHDVFTVSGLLLVDEDGRPIRETRAHPTVIDRARRLGVDMTAVPYPYDDSPSRTSNSDGKPVLIDKAAYDSVMTDFGFIVANIAEIRRAVLQRHESEDTTLTAGQTLEVADSLSTVATYLVWRKEKPFRNGTIPTHIANTQKTMLGIRDMFSFFLSHTFREQHGITISPDSRLNPQLIAQIAELQGSLRGGHGRACAAPHAVIERTLEILIEGSHLPSEAANSTRLSEELGIDIEELMRFTQMQRRYMNLTLDYTNNTYRVIDPILREEVRDQFTQSELSTIVNNCLTQWNLCLDIYLARLNEFQPELDEILGRKHLPNPIDVENLRSAFPQTPREVFISMGLLS